MKGFLFFRGIIEKQEVNVISQNEYNRRRDEMAEQMESRNISNWEIYQRNYYNQMRLSEKQMNVISDNLNIGFFTKLLKKIFSFFKK